MEQSLPSGISRRDLIKMVGAGALYALMPGRSLAATSPSPPFEPGKGHGIIFVVGDGMPLGVTRAIPYGRPLTTIMALAKEEGYGCGLFTTTRVNRRDPSQNIHQHGTPL